MADSIMVLSERREADRCSEFHRKKSIAQIQTEFGQLIISQYNFAPTEQAKNNLVNEGKNPLSVYVTGNTVIDALKTTVKDNYYHSELEWIGNKRLILITAHRRENIGHPMEMMFRGIRRVVDDNKDVKLIYPLHKNPKVREIAQKYLSNHKRIRLIEPLDVQELHNLMDRAYLVMTDSGGLQEEAPALGKPVLVLRQETERPEAVNAGTVKMAGTDEEEIYRLAKMLLDNKEEYGKMNKAANPYGDGKASPRIVQAIKFYFGVASEPPIEF